MAETNQNPNEIADVATNETTGDTIGEAFPGAVSSAYYYVNGATWRDTSRNLNGQISLANAAEGDQISVGLSLAPEYYVDVEGNVAWDALADGVTFGTTMVIDNTAPKLEDVALSLLNNNLTVTASDNEYIAAVALFNKTGTEVLIFLVPTYRRGVPVSTICRWHLSPL